MKKLFTLFAAASLLFAANTSSAQSWGYAGYGHWISDVNEAPDGSIWAAGWGGELPDWTDVTSNYVIKLNSDGTLAWKGSVPSGITGVYDDITTLLPLSGGGAVALCGYSGGAMYKINDDGTVAWNSEAWYSSFMVTFYYGGQLTELSDGRLILGGLSDDLQYHFAEVASDGSLLTTFNLPADTAGGWGWSYYDYMESGIVSTDDGGFAFSAGNDDARTLYKFDSGLNLEWSQEYPHAAGIWEYNNTWNDALSKTSDGGYLLAGSSADAFVYAGTLRKIAADGTLEWANYYNHGSDIEEGALASELASGNYILWTQDAGDQSSHGWVLDADGNQIDSVFVPLPGCNWGFGTGLEVWAASATSDGGYVIGGRQYIADCNQRYTILKSNADGTLPECIWDCVWPGDANNDMYATADDLFEIGINYGDSGTTRMDMGIDWEGKLASEWMDTDSLLWYVVDWGKKYVDCNGDGTINDDDTSAVITNFGLDHPLSSLKSEAGDIPLYFEPVEPMLHIGLNTIPIMLGDDINSVDEIYGIRFTVTVEGEDIDAASLKVNFSDGWLTTTDNRLALSVNDADNKRVFTGVVRKDRENTGGYGEIGTLDVVVIDNITGKSEASEATISFSDIKAIKYNKEEIEVYAESLTFGVEEGSAVNTLADNSITISPTLVSNNSFTVSGSIQITGVEIADLAGRVVSEILYNNTNSEIVNTNNLSAGQYIVTVHTAAGSTMKKIIIQ